MPQRTLKRVLVVMALLFTLTLALPAAAQVSPAGGGAGLWQWLSALLERRVSFVREIHAPSPEDAPPNWKSGVCVDPNGCAGQTTTGGSPRPASSPAGGNGSGGDPNG
jgi:hypothetical protein